VKNLLLARRLVLRLAPRRFLVRRPLARPRPSRQLLVRHLRHLHHRRLNQFLLPLFRQRHRPLFRQRHRPLFRQRHRPLFRQRHRPLLRLHHPLSLFRLFRLFRHRLSLFHLLHLFRHRLSLFRLFRHRHRPLFRPRQRPLPRQPHRPLFQRHLSLTRLVLPRYLHHLVALIVLGV